MNRYRVAYVRGWKIFENNIKKTKTTILANNRQQLFDLLKAGRVDTVLYIKIPTDSEVMGGKPFTQFTVSKVDMYLYTHKKHSGIIEQLATTLREMKKDGTYDQLAKQCGVG